MAKGRLLLRILEEMQERRAKGGTTDDNGSTIWYRQKTFAGDRDAVKAVLTL
jgi:hypothetical protein